jgi:hypothetical protein
MSYAFPLQLTTEIIDCLLYGRSILGNAGALRFVRFGGVGNLSTKDQKMGNYALNGRSDGSPSISTIAGMGVGSVQYQSKTPDIPSLEARLGQMEYTLDALREQLATVKQTIAGYQRRKTMNGDPDQKIPSTAIAGLQMVESATSDQHALAKDHEVVI